MTLDELQANLADVRQLMGDHANEQDEVIAAHSILPILESVLLHLQDFEDEDEEEEESNGAGPQVVWLRVPLYTRLHEHLWKAVASEDLQELMPEHHRESIQLAAELQGQMEGRSGSEVLLELVPDLVEGLEPANQLETEGDKTDNDDIPEGDQTTETDQATPEASDEEKGASE